MAGRARPPRVTASFRTSRATLEEVLASLRRVEAQLDATQARLAGPAPPEPDLAPLRQVHRLRDR